MFIDAIPVEIRDDQVCGRPMYAATGMWVGDGDGESAEFWMAVLSLLRTRGVADVFSGVCDELQGLLTSVNAVFPRPTTHTVGVLGTRTLDDEGDL